MEATGVEATGLEATRGLLDCRAGPAAGNLQSDKHTRTHTRTHMHMRSAIGCLIYFFEIFIYIFFFAQLGFLFMGTYIYTRDYRPILYL